METQGFWLRIYIAMRKSASSTITATADDLTRIARCTLDEAKRSIVELRQKNVCDVTLCNAENVTRNTIVTLTSRSLVRELNSKEKTRLRVARHRSNADVTPPVTVQSKSKKLIVKEKKKEEEATTARKTKSKDEFLAELKTKSVYSHIDIQAELEKADVWAVANNRQVTQRFFVNWLNRIPKPLTAVPKIDPGAHTEPTPKHDCLKCFDTGYVVEFPENSLPVRTICECGETNAQEVQNLRRVG